MMNERIKNYLGVAGIVALAAFSLGALWIADAYGDSSEPNNYRSFSTTGEAKRVIVPDIAQFTFSVITEGGKDVAALQKNNTDKMNTIVAFIKEQGVDKKDIKTSGYNIYPRYQNSYCSPRPLGAGSSASYPEMIVKECPPASIVGYTITQTVEVKVRNFEKLGDLLGGVVQKGGNEVSGVNFTVDDPEKVKDEARAEAIKEAREKAEAIADAGGFDIGRLISINEGGAYPPYYYGRETVANGYGGADMALQAKVAPTIEPGSQEIIVTVSLQFEIED